MYDNTNKYEHKIAPHNCGKPNILRQHDYLLRLTKASMLQLIIEHELPLWRSNIETDLL